MNRNPFQNSRRELLRNAAAGFGGLALMDLLARAMPAVPANNSPAPSAKLPAFAPRAKRVIYLFMAGAPSHLATVDFMSRTGLAIATSPYRGTAPALTDVMGGHVQLLIDASFALMPAARDGKVKTLGITTKERSALAPDIPTIAEQGLDGYVFQSWYGLWAPKGTPRGICDRINALMRETMAEPAIVQRLNTSLLEPVVETSEQSKAFIAAEVPKHVALLKKAGFEAQ